VQKRERVCFQKIYTFPLIAFELVALLRFLCVPRVFSVYQDRADPGEGQSA
jgi:hypothetical protein